MPVLRTLGVATNRQSAIGNRPSSTPNRINLIVEAPHIERPIRTDRRRLCRATRLEFPLLRTVGIDGVDLLVLAAEVDRAVPVDGWRSEGPVHFRERL